MRIPVVVVVIAVVENICIKQKRQQKQNEGRRKAIYTQVVLANKVGGFMFGKQNTLGG